jgi:AraC family carnitine catabolism transcriptional activator
MMLSMMAVGAHTVGLLLFPRFQLLAYVLATETLRIANKVAGRPLFEWKTFTPKDRPVSASNGVEIAPDQPLREAVELSLVLACAGYEPLKELDTETQALLRRQARFGGPLGGLDTGTVILAELGLLSGYRAVVHWEAEAGFRESYPDIAVDDGIYVLDRDRLTAAGGTATGDAMLAWIARVEGADLAARTATALIHGQIRDSSERQRRPVSLSGNPTLLRVIDLMKANLEETLTMVQLTREAAIGKRHMRHLFRRYCGQSPSSFYMGLRLDRARDLLASTAMPAASVGTACGFSSPAWFSRAYVGRFGVPPIQHRRLLLSGISMGHFT